MQSVTFENFSKLREIMRPIINWRYVCSPLRFSHIDLATAVSFFSIFLIINAANAADSSVAREADAAFNSKDYITALSKYTVLAKEGSAAAQFNVGIFYLKGLGTQQDEKQAYEWFKKSALNGHANAKKFIESSAAKGNVYASAALKELHPTITTQTPIKSLPAKAEIPLTGPPHQAPVNQIAAKKPPETALKIAKTKEVVSKPHSEFQGLPNQNIADTSVQNTYVVFDLGAVSLKNMGPGGSNPASSYRIAGGYKVLPYVAAEVGDLKTGTGSYTSGVQNSLNISSIQIAAIFNYSLFGDLDLLGKFGFTSNTTGGDAVSACNCTSSKTLLYGFGAQYNMTKHFGTRVEYTNYGNVTHGATNGDLAMSTITLGLLYSF